MRKIKTLYQTGKLRESVTSKPTLNTELKEVLSMRRK